jgi:hypothetical protein
MRDGACLERLYLLKIARWEIANDIGRREGEMTDAYQGHDKVL